jgi:hypothetical protein
LRVRRDSRTDLTNRIVLGATRFRRMVFSMSFRAVTAFLLDAVEHHTRVREIVGLAR